MSAAVREAGGLEVDVVVLPELAASGYVFADVEEANRCAESVTGETVTLLRELSAEQRLTVISGWCEQGEGDRPYNSAAVVDRGELLANYRKTHLWDREKLIFAVGAERPPVVETRHGRLAVCVCYDLEFPELVRDVALRGAQLIAAPSNWPALVPAPAGERPIEVSKALASAGTNRVVIAVADRCGTERDVPWTGASVICGPDGYPTAGPARVAEPCLLWADVDLTATLDKKLGERNDVFADRRPELYSQIKPIA